MSSLTTSAYKHGGLADYTGLAWVDGTLEEPELVLNAMDTKNLLNVMDLLHQIDLSTIGMLNSMNMFTTPYLATQSAQELQQNV